LCVRRGLLTEGLYSDRFTFTHTCGFASSVRSCTEVWGRPPSAVWREVSGSVMLDEDEGVGWWRSEATRRRSIRVQLADVHLLSHPAKKQTLHSPSNLPCSATSYQQSATNRCNPSHAPSGTQRSACPIHAWPHPSPRLSFGFEVSAREVHRVIHLRSFFPLKSSSQTGSLRGLPGWRLTAVCCKVGAPKSR
jgi:hypothetical protein